MPSPLILGESSYPVDTEVMAEGDWGQVLTLTNLELEVFPEHFLDVASNFTSIVLARNHIINIPPSISICVSLQHLNLSHNNISTIPKEIFNLPNLKVLDFNANQLNEASVEEESFSNSTLETLILSSNQFSIMPQWVLNFTNLAQLHFGANRIKSLPAQLHELKHLKMLYLGGNKLTELPSSIGLMKNMQKLVLSDNLLTVIPDSLSDLSELRILMLHGNRLRLLPQTLIKLENLEELSLRNNPLVSRFIKEMQHDIPTLKELSARFVVRNHISIPAMSLPVPLERYVESSHRCVNPACEGVYFTSRVEHVKFVDFCGRYRVPFLTYLCSPACSIPSPASSSESDEEIERDVNPMQMQRVLLG